MSQLDSIVSVVIDRQTQSVSQTSFGIPGIMGAFDPGDTTVAFTRAREYASYTEMEDDALPADILELGLAIFRQNPNVPKVIVGRRDDADASWSAALNAISLENSDWYLFTVAPITPATPNTEYLQVAAWAETQRKVLFLQTVETGTLSVGGTDIGAQLSALNYDRSAVAYHVAAKASEALHASWLGEGAPFPVGGSTWAYKTPKGVTADRLTTGEKSAAWGKKVNTFTKVGGVDITEKGVVASGEYIDVVIGIDWIESRLQETIFGSLVNLRKISYDDAGIQMVRGLVQSVLAEAARLGIIQGDSIEVTAPKYASIPVGDRGSRNLPDIKFTALLQGAIHTVAISGVVSI